MTKDQRRKDHSNRKRLAKKLKVAADPAIPPRIRKRSARYAAALAEQLGILERPGSCQMCGRRRPLERHHEDYDEPLRVIYACRDCHAVLDRMAWSEASA